MSQNARWRKPPGGSDESHRYAEAHKQALSIWEYVIAL